MAITKIKSPELFDFSDLNTALQLPTGTTAERPAAPSTGEWRYNTTLKYVEYYDGGAWRQIDTESLPTVPSENFNTLLYTGLGAVQSITGAGFEPDMIWVMNRTNTAGYFDAVVDSVRGATSILATNDTAQATTAYTQEITSIDSDGFTLGTGGGNYTNVNTNAYVAWCFNAGSGTAGAGTGTNVSNVTVKASQASGFSILKYDSSGTSGATIAHELGTTPSMVIFKCTTNGSTNWITSVTNVISNKHLYLNNNGIGGSGGFAVDATNITLNNTFGDANTSGRTYMAYSFADVAGFQKIGIYTGDGSTTGPVINTGFEPAWLMIKRYDSAGGWRIQDNKRLSEGFGKDVLEANDTAAEQDNYVQIAFLTNGFQLHSTSGDYNANGGEYLYLAIAADADTTTPTLANSFANSLHVGNGTTQTIGGHLNGAAQFNGSNSYITVPTLSGFTNYNFTMSFWFNSTSTATQYFMDFRNPIYMEFGYDIGSGAYNNTYSFVIYTGTQYAVHSSANLRDGKWHHIAVTYDGATLKMYIDNASPIISTINDNTQSAGSGNVIGGAVGGSSIMDGSIDQVRIYSSALTASQVSQLYNETTATANTLDFPTGGGCVAAYPLDSNGDDLSGNFDASSIPNVTFSNSITFRPDWSWVKNRQVSASHALFDSVRGAMRIVSTESLSTQTDLSPYGVTSFNNYGITVKDITSGNYGVNGAAGGTYSGTPPNYVSWNWKLNKRGTILTNATSLAVDVVANVNDAAGLSVVKGTLNVGSGVTKIPHGLSAAPEFVVAKSTGPGSSETSGWQVYHSSQGAGNYATINSTNAFGPSAYVWANTTPDAELVSVQGGYILYGGADFIMYSWRSISGYSKVGSYAGNGTSKDIYTTDDGSSGGSNPFQPKWVMIKNTSSGYSWVVTDAARGTDKVLYTNLAQGEDTVSNGITAFNSNGFSLGDAVSFNDGSSTYVYLAIGG